MKYKELIVWFIDDSVIKVPIEYLDNAAIELFRYSREGAPRFIELEKNRFYAASEVVSFKLIEEVTNG